MAKPRDLTQSDPPFVKPGPVCSTLEDEVKQEENLKGSVVCPDRVSSPSILRLLPETDLPAVADGLRRDLAATVRREGGHYAGNLGVVELTVALHYVYDTPRDCVVWDTGHQAYPHKMLTERRQRLASIRKLGGLSGFPRRAESEYDTFGVGHAGTSVSAALGMALSHRANGSGIKTAAVVGDGAMSAGLVYEALNHAGSTEADLLVIVNVNGMSISPGVGALQGHLTALSSDMPQQQIKGGLPPRMQASLAESLGLPSYGPVAGHDVIALTRVLRCLRRMTGPRLLFVRTQKGRGDREAETDPVGFHAVSASRKHVSTLRERELAPTFSQTLGRWLEQKASIDRDLFCITPAMVEGSGLRSFGQSNPDRLCDVGIAEQHCVTLAAGLAAAGKKPVVAIYSTFLQRAFDQVIHDVVLQKLPVLFAIDRAGIAGPDGATHAGSYDLSYLRCLPGLSLAAPADSAECRAALDCAYQLDRPAAVRYPRGAAHSLTRQQPQQPWLPGEGRVLRRGQSIAILNFGALLHSADEAAEELHATLADMRWVKPLDEALVAGLAGKHDLLVTVEDNVVAGGAGSAVAECLARTASHVGLLQLGLPDRILEHGTRDELLSICGLDGKGIVHAIVARQQQSRVTGAT